MKQDKTRPPVYYCYETGSIWDPAWGEKQKNPINDYNINSNLSIPEKKSQGGGIILHWVPVRKANMIHFSSTAPLLKITYSSIFCVFFCMGFGAIHSWVRTVRSLGADPSSSVSLLDDSRQDT